MDITARSVTSFINSRYEPPNEKLVPFRNLGERDRIPIILKETESFLSMILKLTRPGKILEIGTAIGYSAAFFAISCPEAEVYSVEKDEYAFNAARKNIVTAGVDDRVHLYLGDGQEVADRFYTDGNRDFDLVFIDAAKSHYRRFLDSVTPLVSDGGLIISDNVFQHGMTCDEDADPKNKHKTNIVNMRSYINHLYHDRHFDNALLAIGDGVLVSIYHKDNEEA